MKKVKSREEMYNSLHLRQAEIQRLFQVSYVESKKIFQSAYELDLKDLGSDRIIFQDKARMSSVLKVMGYTEKDLDKMISRELKSGSLAERTAN